MPESVKTAVVVASVGRPEAAAQLLACLDRTPEKPECFLSVPEPQDVPDGAEAICNVLTGTRGASAQRNVALDAIPGDTDYVFFFDDDAVPRDDYITNMVRFLEVNRDVVAATGNVIADGAPKAREISFEQAIGALEQSYVDYPREVTGNSVEQGTLYGCNFVVRWKKAADMRFDENLPLYSWLEDYDYARRISESGSIASLSGAVAVHRGSSTGGRQAHMRFGYSQVANPVYLMAKGSFTGMICLREALRPVLKNTLYSLLPGRQRKWRQRRLQGNAIALWDLICRRSDPARILDFKV